MASLIAILANGTNIIPELIFSIQNQNYAATRHFGLLTIDDKHPCSAYDDGLFYHALRRINHTDFPGDMGMGYTACGVSLPTLPVQLPRGGYIVIDATAQVAKNIIKIICSYKALDTGVKHALKEIEEIFGLIILFPKEKRIIAARNNGRIPLSYCYLSNGAEGVYVSSQSNVLGTGQYIDDVKPGEMVVINKIKVGSRIKYRFQRHAVLANPDQTRCLAYPLTDQHPACFTGGQQVSDVRIKLGYALGRKFIRQHHVDTSTQGWQENWIAIPILKGGTFPCLGFGQGSGIPTDVGGSTKPQYPVLHPIAPPKGMEINLHRPIESVISGKHVVIVDEGTFDGGRQGQMAREARKMGAISVHGVSVCKTKRICMWGKDNVGGSIHGNLELTASITEKCSLDSFTWLTCAEIIRAIGNTHRIYCGNCFI